MTVTRIGTLAVLAVTALSGCGGGLPGTGSSGGGLRQDIPFAGNWTCGDQRVSIGDMSFSQGGGPDTAIVSIAAYGGQAWDINLMDGRVLTVTSLSDGAMTLTDKRTGSALPCARR